jgi:hypothetical protein
MHLSPENKLILAVVKLQPSAEELASIDHLLTKVIDWNYFANKITDRGIAPLLYKKLPLLREASVIPPGVVSKLQQVYYRTLTRNMMLYDAFGKIAPAFHEQGIDLMVLKGIYLSEYLYHDIGLRQCSDIDILVKPEDGERSLAVLASLGFKTGDGNENDFVAQNREIVHYDPMVLNGVAIEVHIKLHRDIEKYRMDMDELWKKAVPVTVYKNKVYAPDFNDLLIHVCLHLDRHFRQGHVSFTGYNDITNLLSLPIDWSRFMERCKQFKCLNQVLLHLQLAHKYMNATLPDTMRTAWVLNARDENLFLSYLNGHVGFISGVPSHMSSLKTIEHPLHRFRFLLGIIFPSKSFMVEKYLRQLIIKNEASTSQQAVDNGQCITGKKKLSIMHYQLCIKFWWLWYPYRWVVGVKGMIQVIGRK